MNFGLYSQNHIIIYFRENTKLFPRNRMLVVNVNWCGDEYLIVIWVNLLCDPRNEKKKKKAPTFLLSIFGQLPLPSKSWISHSLRKFGSLLCELCETVPLGPGKLKNIGNENLAILPGWRVRGKLFWVTVITVKIQRQQVIFQQIIPL